SGHLGGNGTRSQNSPANSHRASLKAAPSDPRMALQGYWTTPLKRGSRLAVSTGPGVALIASVRAGRVKRPFEYGFRAHAVTEPPHGFGLRLRPAPQHVHVNPVVSVRIGREHELHELSRVQFIQDELARN